MADDFTENIRRLPVYLLLDCSTSMAGEPIAAMEMGLKTLLSDLRTDPQALETVWLSLITFDSTACQVVSLTDVSEFRLPSLSASGTTALGEAIELLHKKMAEEVRKTTSEQKGDWKPLVFVFTDGEPTDDWEEPVEIFRTENRATIVACGAGPEVDEEVLKRLGDKVVRLDNTQPGTLGAFMQWVSASVSMASQAVGTRADSEDMLAELSNEGNVIILMP